MKSNKLSVVTSLFHSEEYIDEFHERLTSCISRCNLDCCEIIFVDDGSPDESVKVVEKIIVKDRRVKLIRLSRNFGHHNAIHAGLSKVSGDLIFLIDVDLEEQPEWLEMFHKELLSKNLDVVFGTQRIRKGDYFEKLTGAIWYSILNACLDIKHTRNITTARLMTSEYVRALQQFEERTAALSGLFLLTGYNQGSVSVKKIVNSKSTYSFAKKLNLVASAVVGLTNKPLFFVLGVNFFFSVLAFLFLTFVVARQLFQSSAVEGWTSLAALLTLSFLLQSVCLIAIGVYIAQINLENKKRPRFIERAEKS